MTVTEGYSAIRKQIVRGEVNYLFGKMRNNKDGKENITYMDGVCD